MPDAFIVELIMQVDVDDPATVTDAAIDFFGGAEFPDDADGGRRQSVEHTMREKLDQALQTLISPRRIADNLPGVSFGGGQVLVRRRASDERMPWEPSRTGP